MTEYRRQYWDSSVFISYLANSNPEFNDVIDDLLAMREAGGVEIVISTFAIAEVRYIEDTSGASGRIKDSVRDEQSRLMRELFDSTELELRAPTPQTAQRAQEIGNQYPGLMPGDCVHIATALDADCKILFTLDGISGKRRRRPRHMIRYSRQLGSPAIPITPPFVTHGWMFDESKIDELENDYWGTKE
ncbi:MAG: PIN domain-containing protein [Thermomicrobiaceae bacterium]